jgi:SAM-dependent methyltransferase
MPVLENKTLFDTVAYHWTAIRKDLIPEEKYLFDNYLDKHGRTIEAGTGGGRILFELRSRGFTSLYGYDYVPRLIAAAKQKDSAGSIQFEVQDAVALTYVDNYFDQILYLQQIICTIADNDARFHALKEAHRILKPGGVALISFLSFEARRKSLLYAPYILYLRLLRSIKRSKEPLQRMPWLKLGGKFNWRSLLDFGPYVYWYQADEAVADLERAGFRVTALGSSHQLCGGEICKSNKALSANPISGILYIVATK